MRVVKLVTGVPSSVSGTYAGDVTKRFWILRSVQLADDAKKGGGVGGGL